MELQQFKASSSKTPIKSDKTAAAVAAALQSTSTAAASAASGSDGSNSKENGVDMKIPKFNPGDTVQENIKSMFKRVACTAKGKYCDYCFTKSDNLKSCTSCGLMHYCDRNCQVKDWKKAHKAECGSKVFREATPNAEDQEKLVRFGKPIKLMGTSFLYSFWAFLKVNPSALDSKKKLWNGKTITLREMVDKYKNFQLVNNMDSFSLSTKEIRNFTEKLKGEDKTVNFKYIRQLYYAWALNCVLVSAKNEETIGYSLNIEIGGLEPSCKPNVIILAPFESTIVRIKALGPIYDGDTLTVRLDTLLIEKDTEGRKQEIQRKFGFECKCELCESKVPFNYPRFLALLEEYKILVNQKSLQIWPELWRTYVEIREMMNYLLHPLDIKIIELIWQTAQFVCEVRICDTMVDDLLKECQESLLKLYGKEHPYVEEFALTKLEFEAYKMFEILDFKESVLDEEHGLPDSFIEEISDADEHQDTDVHADKSKSKKTNKKGEGSKPSASSKKE